MDMTLAKFREKLYVISTNVRSSITVIRTCTVQILSAIKQSLHMITISVLIDALKYLEVFTRDKIESYHYLLLVESPILQGFHGMEYGFVPGLSLHSIVMMQPAR